MVQQEFVQLMQLSHQPSSLFFPPRLMWLLLSKIVTQIRATAILVGTASACVPVLQLMPTSVASKELQFTGDLLRSVVRTRAGLALELLFEASSAFCCPVLQIWEKQVDNTSHFSRRLCVSSYCYTQICCLTEKDWLCSGCASAETVGEKGTRVPDLGYVHCSA